MRAAREKLREKERKIALKNQQAAWIQKNSPIGILLLLGAAIASLVIFRRQDAGPGADLAESPKFLTAYQLAALNSVPEQAMYQTAIMDFASKGYLRLSYQKNPKKSKSFF